MREGGREEGRERERRRIGRKGGKKERGRGKEGRGWREEDDQ